MMSSAVLCATQIKSRNDPVTNLLTHTHTDTFTDRERGRGRGTIRQFQLLQIDMGAAYVKALPTFARTAKKA